MSDNLLVSIVYVPKEENNLGYAYYILWDVISGYYLDTSNSFKCYSHLDREIRMFFNTEEAEKVINENGWEQISMK